MGTPIPKNVAESELSKMIQDAGLILLSRGKVRDTFALPDFPNLLLVFATDRISIFDFVLPRLIDGKGAILTVLTVHWLTTTFRDIKNHLIAYGTGIDQYIPSKLRNNLAVQANSIIVTKEEMLDVECIVRGNLTGSGWKSYKEDGTVCGIELPEGLHDGSKLPEPIFTPTTKAKEGHDEHLNAEEVVKKYGEWIRTFSLSLFRMGAKVAAERGIILADTKFELGINHVLADEVLTPDSSRYWLMTDWEEYVKQKKSPPGYDKEPVRQWGKTVKTPFGVDGINLLEPKNRDHVDFVHGLDIPDTVAMDTVVRYQRCRELFGV